MVDDSSSSNQQTDCENNSKTEKTHSEVTTVRSDSIIQLKNSGEASVVVMSTPVKNTNPIPENENNKKLLLRALQSFESRGELTGDVEKASTMEHFRNIQNKTNLFLFGIAFIFLICNAPRITVKIFHIYFGGRNVQKHFMDCFEMNKLHAPAFVKIMSKL
jgi:hypothetical protein